MTLRQAIGRKTKPRLAKTTQGNLRLTPEGREALLEMLTFAKCHGAALWTHSAIINLLIIHYKAEFMSLKPNELAKLFEEYRAMRDGE